MINAMREGLGVQRRERAVCLGVWGRLQEEGNFSWTSMLNDLDMNRWMD